MAGQKFIFRLYFIYGYVNIIPIILFKEALPMENKELFRIEAQGYRCEDVEAYITKLKAEYKKVFEYADKIKSDNEKLKKICRALSDENKALKAAPAAAEAAPAPDIAGDLDKINALAAAISKESAIIKEKIK